MSIQYKIGDMFDESTEAIVNTVNCVGVMGKGVALEFKRRWPDNFKAYKKLCDQKIMKPGQVFVYENRDILNGNKHKYLINFPTKDHWKARSKIEYIEAGLDDFVSKINEFQIKSVSLPPLGCGNGGLDWEDVRLLIEEKLKNILDVNFIVFTPHLHGQYREQEYVPDDLNIKRAAIMVVFAELEKFFGGRLTALTAQKIVYFMQIMGMNLGLKFSGDKFGPYSETLDKAFRAMQARRYIQGYDDSEQNIIVTPSTYAAADELLKNAKSDVTSIVSRISLLVEGYETPYGMRLLATIHQLSVKKHMASPSASFGESDLMSALELGDFPDKAKISALERLKIDGLIFEFDPLFFDSEGVNL